MFKEKGYDEFVAENVKKGCKQLDQGLGYSLEEAKALSRQAIQRKAQELAQFEKETLQYA